MEESTYADYFEHEVVDLQGLLMYARRQGGAEALGQPRGHGIALGNDVYVGWMGL
jgi:hypothetical protein